MAPLLLPTTHAVATTLERPSLTLQQDALDVPMSHQIPCATEDKVGILLYCGSPSHISAGSYNNPKPVCAAYGTELDITDVKNIQRVRDLLLAESYLIIDLQ